MTKVDMKLILLLFSASLIFSCTEEKPAKETDQSKQIILDGRSTPGAIQENDGMDGWKQIESIIN